MKNLNFCDPTTPPLKTRPNERRGNMRCVLKLTYQNGGHTKSFKEIGDIVQNGLEDFRETAS